MAGRQLGGRHRSRDRRPRHQYGLTRRPADGHPLPFLLALGVLLAAALDHAPPFLRLIMGAP
jgi:hypothetical protein